MVDSEAVVDFDSFAEGFLHTSFLIESLTSIFQRRIFKADDTLFSLFRAFMMRRFRFHTLFRPASAEPNAATPGRRRASPRHRHAGCFRQLPLLVYLTIPADDRAAISRGAARSFRRRLAPPGSMLRIHIFIDIGDGSVTLLSRFHDGMIYAFSRTSRLFSAAPVFSFASFRRFIITDTHACASRDDMILHRFSLAPAHGRFCG